MDRRLGLPSAVALVVANMIGAGVFTTSGFSLAEVGSRQRVLLAWAVGGVLAMCGALSYGALARRFPESGGEYTFLSRCIHPLAGLLAGWVSLLAGFTAPIAAAALALEAYVGGSVVVGLRREWIGTVAILVAGVMHGVRREAGALLQNVTVGVKLIVIAGFIAIGIAHHPDATMTAAAAVPPFEATAFAVTLVWISFSYSGWNAAVYIAGELHAPGRTVHRALWAATALVTAIYIGLNWVFLYAAPAAALSGRAEVGAIAAEALGGPALRHAMTALIVLALFTSISSMVMAGPRVYACMARDGLFIPFFAATEVPRAAIAFQAGLAILVVWLSDLAELLGYMGFTLGLSAAATVVGLMMVRRREDAGRVPIPGYPWIPGTFVVVTVAAAAFMAMRRPGEAIVGLLTMASGILLYWIRPRRRS